MNTRKDMKKRKFIDKWKSWAIITKAQQLCHLWMKTALFLPSKFVYFIFPLPFPVLCWISVVRENILALCPVLGDHFHSPTIKCDASCRVLLYMDDSKLKKSPLFWVCWEYLSWVSDRFCQIFLSPMDMIIYFWNFSCCYAEFPWLNPFLALTTFVQGG